MNILGIIASSKIGVEPESIAVSSHSSPYVLVYPWTNATGFGTKYADPATLPTGQGNRVTVNTAKNAIAVTHNVSPRISVYPWNNSTGFGTKFTNPGTVPTAMERKQLLHLQMMPSQSLTKSHLIFLGILGAIPQDLGLSMLILLL